MYPGQNARSAAYDRVATMFSPDGRLYQVEYASKIVEQGTLGLAITYDKGVLFGAEKKLVSPLIFPDSIEKIFVVDDHIAAVSAGLVGDARRLVQIARQESQENQMYYDQPIETETLVKRISGINQSLTQYGGMRPFGVSFIFGGVDLDGQKKVFEAEPSGALAQYKAVAIGRGKKEAMKILEKGFKDGIKFPDAIMLGLNALKKSLPENETLEAERIDFGYIDDSNKMFKRISLNDVKSYLAKIK